MAGVSEYCDCSRRLSKPSDPRGIANENEILGGQLHVTRMRHSSGERIVLWYWCDADINTSTGMKMILGSRDVRSRSTATKSTKLRINRNHPRFFRENSRDPISVVTHSRRSSAPCRIQKCAEQHRNHSADSRIVRKPRPRNL